MIPKKSHLEETASKSGTPATSVDALMAIAHPLAAQDKNTVGGVLVHMPHVCIPVKTIPICCIIICSVSYYDAILNTPRFFSLLNVATCQK